MANNGAREERVVKIDSGYNAHTAKAFTPKSVTQDTTKGILADLGNRGTAYVPEDTGEGESSEKE